MDDACNCPCHKGHLGVTACRWTCCPPRPPAGKRETWEEAFARVYQGLPTTDRERMAFANGWAEREQAVAGSGCHQSPERAMSDVCEDCGRPEAKNVGADATVYCFASLEAPYEKRRAWWWTDCHTVVVAKLRSELASARAQVELTEAERAVLESGIWLRQSWGSVARWDIAWEIHAKAVDALLTLRLSPDMCQCGHVRSLHNQERGYPEFCPDPCPCQSFEPVHEQAKAEEPK